MELFPLNNPTKSRILVAEDSPVVRTTICALLETDGTARIASSPDFYNAIDIVDSEGPFDFVLLDYNMPGMEGLQGLQDMLAANDQHPVGLISGGIPFDLVERAVNEGASGYIPKVLPPRLIVEAIKMMSEGHRFHPKHFLELLN